MLNAGQPKIADDWSLTSIPHSDYITLLQQRYLELERLRQAVSTLPQSGEGDAIGQPKPSKAVVIAAAVDYIKRIEKERDALQEENERIKYAQGRKRQKMFNDLVTE
jgi:small-conductance mechanosensitive channel